MGGLALAGFIFGDYVSNTQDLDESGAVNLTELNEGLKKMATRGRPLHLSTEGASLTPDTLDPTPSTLNPTPCTL